MQSTAIENSEQETGLMRGFERLSRWFRPSGKNAILAGQVRLATPIETAAPDELAQHARAVDEAIGFLTTMQTEAIAYLRASISEFREAFKAPSANKKTLDRAWDVQQAWHKVRTIENSLRILSKERANVSAMMGEENAPQNPGQRPRLTASA